MPVSDHDGHTVDVGPVTVGSTLGGSFDVPVIVVTQAEWRDLCDEVDRLRAENTALRAVAFAAGSVLDEFGCLGSEIQTCREREVPEGEMCAVCLLELVFTAWTEADR